MFRLRRLALLACAVALVGGCSRDAAPVENAALVRKPSPQLIEQAAAIKVVFAHQSVGNDILQGVGRLAADAGVPISVVETRDAPGSQPGIHHFKVGRNGDPKGKLDDFLTTLTAHDFSGADVALVKVCYIDFDQHTDASRLAEQYLEVLDSLRSKYPSTRFVAATAPLTTIQTGPKAWLKKVLGKQPAGYETNALRQRFNDLLRERATPGNLFDIARLESSGAGATVSFEFDGQQVEALDPNLTYDGGHLNDTGKAVVAAAFIELIGRPDVDSLEHPAGI